MASEPLGIFERQIEPAWRCFARCCSYAAFLVIVIMIFLPSPSYAQSGGTGGDPTRGLIILALILLFYFVPAIVAHNRNHRNRRAITVLNIFLGWTLVGWVIALVWSFTADTEEKSSAPAGLRLLGLSRAEIKKLKTEAQEQDRSIFRPEGMVGDIPYRALPNGEIEALIQGGVVRFQNLDHLRSMTNVGSAPQTGNFREDEAQTTPAPAAATAYRGYTYFARNNGVELIVSAGTKHFPNEGEAKAYVDALLDT